MKSNLLKILTFLIAGTIGVIIGYSINKSKIISSDNINNIEEINQNPSYWLPKDRAAEINTSIGTIQTVEYTENGQPRLFLNKKPIKGSEALDQNVGIFAVIEWSKRIAFLIETDCGGSACGTYSYWILSVSANSEPTLLEIPDLASNLDWNSVFGINGNLFIDFGFQAKSRKVVEFDGKSVKIHSTSIKDARLPNNICERLFEGALANCKDSSNDCENPIGVGGLARSYARISQNFPGINSENFDKLCKASCKGQKPINYELFYNMVCS